MDADCCTFGPPPELYLQEGPGKKQTEQETILQTVLNLASVLGTLRRSAGVCQRCDGRDFGEACGHLV